MKKLLILLCLAAAVIGILEWSADYQPSKNIHKNAPVLTRQQIVIHAPAEKVYLLMTAVNQWPVWYGEVKEPVLQGAFIEGNSFDWKSSGLTIHSIIHTAIPYYQIGWHGRAFGAYAIHNWTFKEHDGYTTVTVEESMEGWLVSLMKNTFQHGLEQSLQVWMGSLKTAAETHLQTPS
jgi:hypothetical protein